MVPLNYGRCTALALDPIEKKPLVRYMPGSTILSYGSFGCNLSCAFCQNWQIAQAGKSESSLRDTMETSANLTPHALIAQAKQAQSKGNIGIAFTYNEPLVCSEYILDVAVRAHEEDLKIVLVSNGYAMQDTAKEVFAHIDAANIDLKAFRQEFYTQVGAPAGLSTVKRTIEIAVDAGCHVELTTLIVSGLNDSPDEMEAEASWIASLNPSIPLHINRFYPAYKMNANEPTPRDTLKMLEKIAKRHLKYVYVGNC